MNSTSNLSPSIKKKLVKFLQSEIPYLNDADQINVLMYELTVENIVITYSTLYNSGTTSVFNLLDYWEFLSCYGK